MSKRTIIAVMVTTVVLMNGGAEATTYYVDPNGSDDANGLSWETAFATIQKGINEANDGTVENYDIIDVNSGTYVTGPFRFLNQSTIVLFEALK